MENPVIGFGLEYAGELVYCEAVMHDRYYEIRFDGKFICNIEYTDNFDWIQTNGQILTEIVISEIGFRIDSYYK